MARSLDIAKRFTHLEKLVYSIQYICFEFQPWNILCFILISCPSLFYETNKKCNSNHFTDCPVLFPICRLLTCRSTVRHSSAQSMLRFCPVTFCIPVCPDWPVWSRCLSWRWPTPSLPQAQTSRTAKARVKVLQENDTTNKASWNR